MAAGGEDLRFVFCILQGLQEAEACLEQRLIWVVRCL